MNHSFKDIKSGPPLVRKIRLLNFYVAYSYVNIDFNSLIICLSLCHSFTMLHISYSSSDWPHTDICEPKKTKPIPFKSMAASGLAYGTLPLLLLHSLFLQYSCSVYKILMNIVVSAKLI